MLYRSGLKSSSVRQKRLFLLGWLSLVIANYWPVADAAQHDLLLARLMQQMLVTLAASPLILLSLPRASIAALTRPHLVDTMLVRLTRPVPAALIFTATAIFAMTPAMVDLEVKSVWYEQAVQLTLLAASSVGWLPILRLVPGVKQLSTAARLAYLFALSLLPSVPAIVLIFAKRPLYPSYIHSSLGLSSVADQQLTGALAKIGTLGIFWGVAIAILLKADKDEALGLDPDPMTLDDVQREFDRSATQPPTE